MGEARAEITIDRPADDVWAKLLWAGLNLSEEDLPAHGHSGPFGNCDGRPWYPIEMVRAVALLWLFSGLRSNEIHRLRTGCIRTQTSAADIAADNAGEAGTEVCLLDVPVTKTSTAFTKPIDPIVGQAIEAWERVRPAQPRFTDAKTGVTQFAIVHAAILRGRTCAPRRSPATTVANSSSACGS